MVFGLSPLQSAAVVFANSVLGKIYMTSWRSNNPDGAPGDPIFENAHRAQLNEAEWSPLLFGGLCLLGTKGVDAPVACSLVAFGSVWYLWSRAPTGLKNGSSFVLPGGIARYLGGLMLAYQIARIAKRG